LKFFKKILEFQGFAVHKAEKELLYLDSLNNSDFKKWAENKKQEIVKYHFDNNPFYRKILNNVMSENWVDIPVIKKQMIQRPLVEMVNSMYDIKDCYVSSTSGSSGTPLFFAKDKFAHAMTWALIIKRYNDLGITLQSMQARFYGIPLQSVTYLKERFKDRLMNRYRFTIFDMSDRILEKFLDKFRHTSFDYIYGYTNSLLLFAKYCIRKNIILKDDACRSLRLCIVTSEQCTDEDKLLLEEAFGVNVVREYGVSESDFIAITDRQNRWIISDELVHVEIVDENDRPLDDGKIGKIIVTSLHNKAMPFIRYEVGDWGSIKRGERYSELLTLNGRLNDIAWLPSGKTVPGFTLYYVSRQILEESGVLKEYVIKQTSANTFLFEVVTTEPLSENHIQLIKNTMYQYLEPGIIVVVKRVDAIKRQASGKLKHFHSLIKND